MSAPLPPSQLGSFGLLAGEALRDAARRRIVIVIAGVCIVSLTLIDGCTSCGGGDVVVNQVSVEASRVGAAIGALMVATLGLWIPVLAGVLAADPLARAVSEGSALLWLSRPVRRETFALAQLAGALAVALGAGALLVGSAITLLALRQGLPPGPALAASTVMALNATAIAALAMLASLWLPRAALALLVFAAVGMVSGLEAAALAGLELGGVPGAIARLAPPFLQGPATFLSAWVPEIDLGPAGPALLRATLWPVASALALCATFRRLELRG
jgi:hypothetical protein